MNETKQTATLITGASTGIGESVCRRLAKTGCHVVNLSNVEAPRDLPAETIIVDLSNETDTEVAMHDVLSRYNIQHLVNNAGVAHDASLEEISLDDLRRLFELHVRAAIQIIQATVPQMKQRRYGRIVNMGSRTMLGKPNATVYALTKSALLAMSRCIALELAPFGISVNLVAPGPTNTNFFSDISDIDDPKMVTLANSIPMGRFSSVDEVSAAVEYFLSPDAAIVTGQTLFVCGGLSVNSASV